MFGNVFILMECYLKLGTDVDYSDFTCYVCCFQTGWHCFQTWLVFRSKNRSLNACIEFKNWKDSFENQCSHDICLQTQNSTMMNEWFWAFSSKLCVPEGISFAGSPQTWLICILIILSHFSYFKLIYNWFRESWFLRKMARWWSKISNFINLTVKWNICNVPSYHYLTEVDFTEVIEPDGYLLLI